MLQDMFSQLTYLNRLIRSPTYPTPRMLSEPLIENHPSLTRQATTKARFPGPSLAASRICERTSYEPSPEGER